MKVETDKGRPEESTHRVQSSISRRGAATMASRLAAGARSTLGGLSRIDRGQLTTGAAILISAIGIAVRVRVYAAGRSLWFDEAVLALNLVDRSLGGMFPPYDYGQVAPVGFMLLAKSFMLVLGNTDYVLRIVPLLAGVAAVPLTYLLARQWSRGWAPLLALGMIALAPALIYYSSEVKQYSSDALATIALLLAGWACSKPESSLKEFVILGIVGFLAMWISHPSLFVLAGVLLTLGGSFLEGRNWPHLLRLTALGILFAANFALLYVTSLKHWAGQSGLTDFWQGSFAPLSGPGVFGWYRQALGDFANPSALSPGLFALILFMLGILSFGFRSRWLLAMAGAPILIALVASALHLYPFTGRFLLFGAPIAFILLAEGVEWISQAVSRWRPAFGTAIAAACSMVLLVAPADDALGWIGSPPVRDHVKPALAYLSQHRQASDIIYLYYSATPQFRYYAPFYSLDSLTYVDGLAARGNPVDYLADIRALAGKPRVWLLFSHVYRSGKLDEQAYFVQHLDQIGTRLDEYHSPGVTLYLYDLSTPPPG